MSDKKLPNAPSTTGKPSGRGRGNNPPKGPKASRFPPPPRPSVQTPFSIKG